MDKAHYVPRQRVFEVLLLDYSSQETPQHTRGCPQTQTWRTEKGRFSSSPSPLWWSPG